MNGALGVLLLLLVNFIGGSMGIEQIIIPINAISALIAGFLGVPGVIFLIILNNLM